MALAYDTGGRLLLMACEVVIIVKSVTIANGTRAAVDFQSIQYETKETVTNIDDGIYS